MQDVEILNTFKALHIIFVVAWYAGLFYVPRLFIYQVEAQRKDEPEKSAITEQLKLMTRRLWFIITWPAMVITLLTAVGMVAVNPTYLQLPWMHVKLAFVVLLLAYHISLHWLYKKQSRDEYPMGSNALRFYNELATVLLFAIVFTVVFKNTLSWAYGAGGLILLGLVLSVAIMFYKQARNRKE